MPKTAPRRAGLRTACALLFGAAMLFPDPLQAATATTTFQVRITIQDACIITSAGTLDFGSNGVLAANVDASSTLNVQCTVSTPYTISLDPGAGSGASVAVRKMTGPASAIVNYSLYQDPTRSILWGQSIGTDTVASTGTGSAQPFTVYGRVPPQTTPGAGLYTDTITVTVTY